MQDVVAVNWNDGTRKELNDIYKKIFYAFLKDHDLSESVLETLFEIFKNPIRKRTWKEIIIPYSKLEGTLSELEVKEVYELICNVM